MEENNTTILLKTIASLLEGKKYTALREVLATMNPADIAALFEDLDEAMLPLIFRLLPKELAAEAFVEMDADLQEMLIQGFSTTRSILWRKCRPMWSSAFSRTPIPKPAR